MADTDFTREERIIDEDRWDEDGWTEEGIDNGAGSTDDWFDDGWDDIPDESAGIWGPIQLSDSTIDRDLVGDATDFLYDESAAVAEWSKDQGVKADTSRPLWEVYLDGTRTTGRLLHTTDVDSSTRIVLQPKLSLELNEPGSFDFTIIPSHVLYDSIEPYRSTVTVYSEGVELFRGRVTDVKTDIYRQKSVSCEGDLAYLSDVIFKLSVETDAPITTTVGDFINLILARYMEAAEVSTDSPRYLGNLSYDEDDDSLTVAKKGNELTYSDDSWRTARDWLDDIISTYGGYIRTRRHDDGIVYLEYISGYTAVNNQTIAYGSSLQTISIENDTKEFFTVLIPEGDSVDGAPIALTALKTASTDDTTEGATIQHSAKSEELIWKEGVAKYGRIMRQQGFPGIKKGAALLARSVSYFKEAIQSLKGNYSINAVDMHFVNPNYRPIYLGEKVRIVSAPHGIDTANDPVTCMRVEYDLTNPDKTHYEFDVPYQMLRGKMSTKTKKTKKKVTANENRSKANTAKLKTQEDQLSSMRTDIGILREAVNRINLAFETTLNCGKINCTGITLNGNTLSLRVPTGTAKVAGFAYFRDEDGMSRWVPYCDDQVNTGTTLSVSITGRYLGHL